MKTLIVESEIGCSVETLFAFHADPANLPLITPEAISVCIEQMPERLDKGSRAVLYIKRGLFRFRWHLRFDAVEAPCLIVDIAERSPFKSFRHEHRFVPVSKSACLLRDEVSFSLPLGRLGRLLEPLIARDLQAMFSYRHAETKKRLEKRDIPRA